MTYKTLMSLTAQDPASKKPFETLTMLLKDHLDPQTSEIAEQHQFLLRIQHEGESIANFVADLKMYTTYFNFVCTSCKKLYRYDSPTTTINGSLVPLSNKKVLCIISLWWMEPTALVTFIKAPTTTPTPYLSTVIQQTLTSALLQPENVQ
jgi:hypothetical protein